MKRREVISVIGGAAAWPLAAGAQQGERMRRIGLLLVSGSEPLGPFREALADIGYVEGKNIQIEVRSAQGQDTLASSNWRRNWFAAESMSSSQCRPRPSVSSPTSPR